MGFDEVFVDMVCKINANNWYSFIVNGKRYGFFYSSRGLKQGSFPCPIYFRCRGILRSLKKLYKYPDYHGFFMEIRGPQVNNLSFVDDIFLFTSGRGKTLKHLMATLKEYEDTFGKIINGDKRHFMLLSNAFNSTRDIFKRLTGFKQMQGPIN